MNQLLLWLVFKLGEPVRNKVGNLFPSRHCGDQVGAPLELLEIGARRGVLLVLVDCFGDMRGQCEGQGFEIPNSAHNLRTKMALMF
jgi:hypothetical protein